MTITTLATISIVLSEVLVVILAVAYYLFRKNRRLKIRLQQSEQTSSSTDTHPHVSGEQIVKDYLQSSIDKLADQNTGTGSTGAGNWASLLQHRQSILEAEINISALNYKEGATQAYWDAIQHGYQDISNHNQLASISSDYEAQIVELQSEIGELRVLLEHSDKSADQSTMEKLQDKLKLYKDMVNNTNDKLMASSRTISDLQALLNRSECMDDKDDMAAMIDKLKDDNTVLKEQLTKAKLSDQSIEQSKNEALKIKDEEIEMYMGLINQANEKLRKSSQAIDEFKVKMDQSAPFEELKQMEDMVEKLNDDNSQLMSQLDSLKSRFQAESNDPNIDINVYREMAKKASDKLLESNKTIEQLQAMVADSDASDELKQMANMVEMLSQDNSGLRKQLDDAQQQARENYEKLKETSDEQRQKLSNELVMYKDLVVQANDKLKESNATIAALKQKIEDSNDSLEIDEMREMLEKLITENAELEAQLQAVNTQLQVTLDNVKLLDAQDDHDAKRIKILSDEKWFLEEQLRHMTTQNDATIRQLRQQVEHLEAIVAQKDLEN